MTWTRQLHPVLNCSCANQAKCPNSEGHQVSQHHMKLQRRCTLDNKQWSSTNSSDFLGYCLGGLSGSFSRSMSSQISVHRQQSEEVSSVPANSSAGPACNKATASVWVHWETYVGQGRNLIHKYRCIRLPRGERQRRVKWNCQDRLITLRVWHRFYCTAQTLLTSTILINDATKMWKFPVFSTCKHPVLHYAVETS